MKEVCLFCQFDQCDICSVGRALDLKSSQDDCFAPHSESDEQEAQS